MDDWKISRREFIKFCGKAILLSSGIGFSGCIERIYGYDPPTKKKLGKIKFITVGDPHVKINFPKNRGNERLINIVDFIDKSDANFAVFLGDMADDGKDKTQDTVKDILQKMKKPYYVVIGNHDIIVSPNVFESHYGPMEHIEIFKGYQLIFPGIYKDKDQNGKTILRWSFDFNKADKDLTTLVFLHGPITDPPLDCKSCNWGENYFGYGKSMKSELDKFTNLLGVYSGHVHFTSDQTFNGVRHITLNGLVTKRAGGISATPSDEVGYTKIKNNKLDYNLLIYNDKNNIYKNETETTYNNESNNNDNEEEKI